MLQTSQPGSSHGDREAYRGNALTPPADQNWWASGCAIAGRPTGRLPGRYAENGALRRPHHMRPQLGDSAGRRSASNREQRCAALGAVAVPAGATVWQGHLTRVGDGDLFAADASALWVGLRRLGVPCARFNHGPAAYSRPIGLPAGAVPQDHSQRSLRSPRLPVGSRTTARSRRPVSRRVR